MFIRTPLKNWMLLIAIGLMASLPELAHAATTDCKGTSTPSFATTTPLPGLKIPRDLPIGAAIPGGKLTITQTSNCLSTTISGTKTGWLLSASADVVAVAGLTNVYTIAGGPSGIGFRILNASGSALPIGTVDLIANSAVIGGAPKGQTTFTWIGAFELVKVAATPAAGSQSIRFSTSVTNEAWANGDDASSSITISYTVDQPALTTCTVANPTQTVSLPHISATTANASPADGASSLRAAPVPFRISLNCTAAAQLYMTFTDANNPSNTSNIVRAAGAPNVDDSYGVGILYKSLADGDVRVSLGPDASAANTTNQIHVGSTSASAMNLDFLAFYAHGPGAKFPVGLVSTKATFTLSYQ